MAASSPWTMASADHLERSPLFPDPLTCLREMFSTGLYEFDERVIPRKGVGAWLAETWESLEVCFTFDPSMIVWAAVICVLLTVARMRLNRSVFEPFARRSKLTKESAEKLPESIWKGAIYIVTWTWSAYLTHSYDIMFDITSHWNTWYPKQPVPTSFYWLFTLEVGFYFHSILAMLFMEQRRKDFVVLLLHHILTIALIVGSYSVSFYIVGLFLIFIHDIGDVFLEVSKCFNYFKIQNGRPNKMAEQITNVGFLLFAVQYFLFRIYWFTTKALYSTLYVCVVVYPRGPFYLPFNIMLLSLLAMQIYWFTLIIKLLVKVLILREDLTDIRDIEEEEKEEKEEEEKEEGGGREDGKGAKVSNGAITTDTKKKQ